MGNNKLSPFGDVKKMSRAELTDLCVRLREEIISSVSRCGGHLASNLGVVELTVALHRVFDLPDDKLIFDVSHQSYVHKMLTGRIKGFDALRSYGGVSGFQLRSESEYDFFGGGHSGTAISAALGFAEAEKLRGGTRYAVAVVGDGSFTNGMVYEALNNASKKDLKLIIVLNDNEMSISKNVGGVSRYFSRLRTSVRYFKFKRKFKNGVTRLKLLGRPIAAVSRWMKDTLKRLVFQKNLFEHLGMDYIGPVDGHDIAKLEAVMREAKLTGNPVLIHVCTVKGKGYAPAEQHPADYHAVTGFSVDKGIDISQEKSESFSLCFGKCLTSLAEKDERVVAITAAMSSGTGLSSFKTAYPDRLYDVGIAEEHAVTFAAGLAAAGKIPVFAVYSSFLQRGFDQILHDISVQELHIILAVDRSGFVPGDGVTHQGIFDLAFLLSVPGMTVFTPSSYNDLSSALETAINSPGAVAVRYPKGGERAYGEELFTDLGVLRYREYGHGEHVTIITYGTTLYQACEAAEELSGEFCVRVIGIKQAKPLDIGLIYEICKDSKLLVFAEEQVKKGGLSEGLIAELCCRGYALPEMAVLAVDESFPTHASYDKLCEIYGLDTSGIVNTVRKHMSNNN